MLKRKGERERGKRNEERKRKEERGKETRDIHLRLGSQARTKILDVQDRVGERKGRDLSF